MTKSWAKSLKSGDEIILIKNGYFPKPYRGTVQRLTGTHIYVTWRVVPDTDVPAGREDRFEIATGYAVSPLPFSSLQIRAQTSDLLRAAEENWARLERNE